MISYVYRFKFRISWYLLRIRIPYEWEIEIEQRRKDNFMGRFGGGWNWELGILIGSSDIIINYLVGSIRISRRKNGK